MKLFRRRRVLWLMIPALFGAFLFRESIITYSAPRLVLSRAVPEVFSRLESRLIGSPVLILAEGFDAQGRYDIDFTLDTSSDLLGLLRWKLNIQTQGDPAQVLASGSIATGDHTINLSMYFDDTFAAVSPQNGAGAKFYGFGYETFSQDLRDNLLLPALVSKETIGQWDASIKGLRGAMERSYTLPEVTIEDIRTALLGIMALKPRVSRQEITLAGQNKQVHTVSFHATGQEIATLTEGRTVTLPQEVQNLIQALSADPDSDIRTGFYLSKGTILRIRAALTCSGKVFQFTADLGDNPQDSPISFTLFTNDEGIETNWTLTSEISRDNRLYWENLTLAKESGSAQENTTLSYSWDAAAEEWKLRLDRQGREHVLRLMLHPTDKGFRVQTDQFYALVNVFAPTKNTAAAIGTIDVSKGAPFATPEYLDFSQWSMEDTLSLLSSFGSFLGIPTS